MLSKANGNELIDSFEKSKRLAIASIESQDESQRNFHYPSDNNNRSIPLKHSTPDNNNKKKTTNLAEDESLAYIIQNQKRDINDDSKFHINDMKNSPSIVKDDINIPTNEYSNTDNTLRSFAGTILAIFLCTKTSPGPNPNI